jgi:hypothetical protein
MRAHIDSGPASPPTAEELAEREERKARNIRELQEQIALRRELEKTLPGQPRS